ncbi:hypothetical protein F4604DRAFT_1750714 [Suillus subluteus]|nr:hypothetical protein F4604DRAFT_1750714 [Suillus subluteus]
MLFSFKFLTVIVALTTSMMSVSACTHDGQLCTKATDCCQEVPFLWASQYQTSDIHVCQSTTKIPFPAACPMMYHIDRNTSTSSVLYVSPSCCYL